MPFGGCCHQLGNEVAGKRNPEDKEAERREGTERRVEGGSANQRKYKLDLKYVALKRGLGCYWDI